MKIDQLCVMYITHYHEIKMYIFTLLITFMYIYLQKSLIFVFLSAMMKTIKQTIKNKECYK